MHRHSICIAIILLSVGSVLWPDGASAAGDYDPVDIEDFVGLLGYREENFVRAFTAADRAQIDTVFSEAPDEVQVIVNEELDRAALALFRETIEPAAAELTREYFTPAEIVGYLDGDIVTLANLPAFQQALEATLKAGMASGMERKKTEMWAATDQRLVEAGYNPSRYYAAFSAAAVAESPADAPDQSPVDAYASPDEIPSTAFVGDPVGGVLLADDGQHVSLLYTEGDRYRIMIRRTDEPDSPGIEHSRPLRNRLHQIEWSSDYSLVLDRKGSSYRYIDGQVVVDSYHRLSKIEIGGANMIDVVSIDHQSSESFAYRTIVDMLPDDPERILVAYSPDGRDYPGVHELNLSSGEFEVAQPSQRPIQGWWADSEGVVRLGVGMEGDRLVVIARAGVESPWLTLSNNEVFQPGQFDIVSFDPDPALVLVRSSANSGRSEIYRMSLESGRLTEKVFGHPKVDAADTLISRQDQRLLAVGYVEDRHRYRYFDPEFAESMQHVDKALPDRSNIIRTISHDDRFVLIYSIGGAHPGSFYSFDRDEQSLTLIEANNAMLDPNLLAPVQAVTYFARDGLEISAYVTVPRSRNEEALPAIVMPHDVNEGRALLEYNFIAQFLASRGYLVIQPNYRGSTGYGAAFQSMGLGQWGEKMQSDLTDAALFLIDEGLADPARICSAGWSYGGYAALMSVIQEPDIFACAIALAPITNLTTTLQEVRESSGDVAVQSVVGKKKGKALKAISPIDQVKTLKRPLLILHGTKDEVVPFTDSIAFVKKLEKYKKPHQSMSLMEADHVLTDPRHRAALLDKMERFLTEYIGAPIP